LTKCLTNSRFCFAQKRNRGARQVPRFSGDRISRPPDLLQALPLVHFNQRILQ
jgi:hypothetical protein